MVLNAHSVALRIARAQRSCPLGPGRCRRPQQECPSSPFVFVSERGSPFTTAGFARMIERTAAGAGLELKAHPHMLRHACGYALANKGHDTRAIQGWLGHRSITSTGFYSAGAEPV
jgi:site-specific recombinase XerD